MSDDDKLRRAFAELRERDAKRAPPFEEIVRRGRPRPVRSPWAIAAPIALCAAAVLVWCRVEELQRKVAYVAAPPAPPAGAVAAGVPAPSPDPEPLGFLLTLPGSGALSAASTLSLGEGSP